VGGSSCPACAGTSPRPFAVVKRSTLVGRGQGWYPPLASANSAWRSLTRPGRRPHRQRRYIALDRWPDSTRYGATLHSMCGLREPDISPVKRCRRCGETKRREAFGPNRRHRDGLHSWCRSCVAAWNRRWRAANREVYNARRRVDPYPPRTCATCGQEFIPVRFDQRYCCRSCREHRYLIGLPATPISRWSEITRRVATSTLSCDIARPVSGCGVSACQVHKAEDRRLRSPGSPQSARSAGVAAQVG
jgi:hypothetical protein